MSVHTLTQQNGMVQIGAAVTRAEALDAAATIARFCYKVNDLPAPIILSRPNVTPSCQLLTPDGTVALEGADIVFRPVAGSVVLIRQPRALAAAVIAIDDYLTREPDPDSVDVERLAAFLDEAMDADPESLALHLVRTFKVEERPA